MQWLRRIKNCLLGQGRKPDAQAIADPAAQDDRLACRPATWDDVLAVTSLLEQHQVKYVLLGGYALYARGIIRQTGDVYILVENTPENNMD